jgi:hypothetical protein
MKKILLIIAVLLGSLSISGQEIPAGVRYKKASQEVNRVAKNLLEKYLPGQTAINVDELFGKKALMCGPFLWKVIGNPNEFKGGTPVMLMVKGGMIEGKGITDSNQKKLLWKHLVERNAWTANTSVRKASADEISFYWGMIPFDIEEPLFVADYGSERILINFSMDNGKPKVFWVDIISKP